MTPKQMILRALCLIFVGFIAGAYVAFPKKELRNPTPQAPVAETPTVAQNKLFSFFDTFTADKDMGTARTEFMYPEEHLLVLYYPTSQETGSYAVYDYKNDIMHDKVGDWNYVASQDIPVAFVGTDKLLIKSSTENQQPSNSITIRDFQGNIIQELFKNASISEIYPHYGKNIFISTQQEGKQKTYILDTETLTLTEQGPPKG